MYFFDRLLQPLGSLGAYLEIGKGLGEFLGPASSKKLLIRLEAIAIRLEE